MHERQHGGAKRGGLVNHGPVDAHIDDVGKELHQPVILRHAAIDTHGLHLDAVAGDRGEQVVCLVGHRLKGGARQLGRPGLARDAVDGAARFGAPVRRPQTGERRHHVDGAVRVEPGGHGLGLLRRLDDAKPVAKPLDDGPRDEDGALKRIGGGALETVADGGEQPVARGDGLVARVDDDETSGAIGGFERARGKAALAYGGGLLVAGDAAYRNRRAKNLLVTYAELGGAVHDRGKPATRHVEHGQQLIVPVIGVDVVEVRAARVGGVGGVNPAAGQPPDEKTVHGAKAEFSRLCPFAGALNLVEYPGELGRGEIGVEKQAGLCSDAFLVASFLEGRAYGGRSSVLPYDGVVDGLAACALPDDGCLTLVCYAYGRWRALEFVRLAKNGACDIKSALPDILGIVFNPTVLREYLRELGGL